MIDDSSCGLLFTLIVRMLVSLFVLYEIHKHAISKAKCTYVHSLTLAVANFTQVEQTCNV